MNVGKMSLHIRIDRNANSLPSLRAFTIGACLCLGCCPSFAFAQDSLPETDPEPLTSTFIGMVVDKQGNPIAGATVLLDDHKYYFEDSPEDFITLTDDEGQFEINVQPASNEQESPAYLSDNLWAYKKGYSVRCVTAQCRDELHLVLPDEESVTFRITHPTIALFDDVTATPYYFDVPNGCYTSDKGTGLSAPIPLTLRKMLAGTVLPDGNVVLRGVTKALLNSAMLESPRLGQQYGPVPGTISLRETGSLQVSLNCPPESIPANCRVSIRVDRDFERRQRFRSGVSHWGLLDGNHQLIVPVIGSGQTKVSLSWPEDSDLIPLAPPDFEIRAGVTNELEISTVRAVEVRGRVFASDTNQPLCRAKLSFFNEESNFRRSATSDLNGRYSVRVPPGSVSVQLYVLPLSRTHQYPEMITINIPDQVTLFEMSPIAVDPKGSIRGFLIDEHGRRVQGRTVVLLSPTYRHAEGLAKTDDRGNFLLRVSNHTINHFRESLEASEKGTQVASRNLQLNVLPDHAPKDPILVGDYIKNSTEESPHKIMSKHPLVLKLLPPKPVKTSDN